MMSRTPLILATALLFGCGHLPTTPQMQLPEGLHNTQPATWPRLGHGRQGQVQIDGLSLRYERGADRLSLFGPLVESDRVSLRWSGDGTQTSCRGRALGVTVGVVTKAPRPWGVDCRFEGDSAGQLSLQEQRGAAGTHAGRSGRYSAAGVVLDVQSVHRVHGSPLPIEAPVGYLMLQDGRAVGAVELTGDAPRVWRSAPDLATQNAVSRIALTLALLWDPAVVQR